MGIFDIFKKKDKNENKHIDSLDNQHITSATKIRMCYVAMEKFSAYDTNQKKIGQTTGLSSVFELPQGMSLKDACKVISYLSEKTELENKLEPASENSVAKTSAILENYGFKKIDEANKGHYHCVQEYRPFSTIKANLRENQQGAIDLLTVGGDFDVFKKSNLYATYFDWFTENVKKQEVEQIYQKIGQKELFESAENPPSRVVESTVNIAGEDWKFVCFLDKGPIVVEDDEKTM